MNIKIYLKNRIPYFKNQSKKTKSKLNEKFKTKTVLLSIIELIIILLIFIFEKNAFGTILKFITILPLTVILFIVIMHYTERFEAKGLIKILEDIDKRKAFRIYRIQAIRVEKSLSKYLPYYIFHEKNGAKVIISKKAFNLENESFPNDDFGLIHEEIRHAFGNTVIIFGKVLVPVEINSNKLRGYFRDYRNPVKGEIKYIEGE